MATCDIQPKPEMYGVGIRVAFYVQWLGTIWFNSTDQTALADLRLLGLCLSGSMTIAVLIESVDGRVEAVEMYLMIVLATGGHMFLVPIYIWRVITRCRRHWDPSYWMEEEPLQVYRILNFATVFAGSGVATWYFVAALPGLDGGCEQYGFLFGEASLKNWALIVLNSMLHVGVVAACTLILVAECGGKSPTESSRRRRRHRRENSGHVRFLNMLRFFSDCVVWVMLILHVELTITYNNLSGVNDISSAAQLFVLFAGIGACLRAYWVHAVDSSTDDDGEETVQYYGWPMTCEDWWALAEYQQAMDDSREYERWSRSWRRQMRRAYRGWIH